MVHNIPLGLLYSMDEHKPPTQGAVCLLTYLEIAVRKIEQNTNSSVNINFTQGRGVADVKTSEKTELRGLELMSAYLFFRRVWVNQKACSST